MKIEVNQNEYKIRIRESGKRCAEVEKAFGILAAMHLLGVLLFLSAWLDWPLLALTFLIFQMWLLLSLGDSIESLQERELLKGDNVKI